MLLTQVAIAALVCSPAVSSVGDSNEPISRPNHIGVNLGVGSSVGALGVSYDRDLGRYWQLQGGAGFGSTGLEFSLMPRFVLRIGAGHALFAGAGASVGILAHNASTEPLAVWANSEVGYQHEWTHVFFQFGLDYSVLLRGEAPPPCFLCDVPYLRPGAALPGFRFTAGLRF
jgi:hypothetical protein